MRPRGVRVYPLPDASGPNDSYALVVRPDGQVRMVHTEGVAYVVSEDKPWRWNDFSECREWSRDDLIRLAFISWATPPYGVDLADWVRVFGARLESNFSMIYHWATSGE